MPLGTVSSEPFVTGNANGELYKLGQTAADHRRLQILCLKVQRQTCCTNISYFCVPAHEKALQGRAEAELATARRRL